MKKERYVSFDRGNGKKFENGSLGLRDLRQLALKNGEPTQISGKQRVFGEPVKQVYLSPFKSVAIDSVKFILLFFDISF
jgi:xylose isomerase